MATKSTQVGSCTYQVIHGQYRPLFMVKNSCPMSIFGEVKFDKCLKCKYAKFNPGILNIQLIINFD